MGKSVNGMIDEEYLNMFIREAKKAYKTIDNKSYNFPITINTAYRLAINTEKCLKKQSDIVRCENCRFLIDHYGFMDDGYCMNMRNKYNIKFKPDKNWFCADGKLREGGEGNE